MKCLMMYNLFTVCRLARQVRLNDEGGDFSFRFFMALYESKKKLCHMSRFYADRVKAGQKKKNIKPEIESPT